MIAARTHRIPQCGKPGALDERRIKRKLSPRNPASIEHVHIVGIIGEFCVFQLLRLHHQLLDAFFLRRIGGPVRYSNKVVVRVIASIHRSHAIQLPHLNRGEQVIHRERIIRMTTHDLLEILNRRVVIKVVVVLESGLAQGIIRTKISGMKWG